MSTEKIQLLCLVAAFLTVTARTELSAEYAPQVGQLHQDFVLPDIETREPIALADFRGKKVLLIHFASW